MLSPQIGSAIQKANLFEEVREFGESLKVKVAEATSELQERNVSLQTLQHITTNITRTLDFGKAVQNIADSVATELGYIGAVLVFLDDDGRTVRARAITETPLTRKAMKVLPIKFNEYTTDINDPSSNSLGHQAIRSGEIKTTEHFSDVVSPPLPKPLAAMLQKLLGMKSMVIIPIVSEGRTIGVIEIGLQKGLSEISKQEIATMQSMADELGIVSRNLKLFDQLRKANDDLELANKHLQQLDQAKSEFVSIASHQLRTPMTGIMGYLSMMVEGDFGKIEPKHMEILKNLLEESQRMIRLINLFLNVSKIEAGKFTITRKEVQMIDVIDREVRELTKIASDKGLELKWRKPTAPFRTISVDADKLQDVLLNLIDNAIKYTKEGSVTISAEESASGITVHIKDTGIGISKANIAELFNKFVRAQGIAQIHPDGSGLGLFIAKSIVEGHNGKIWVESDGEGQGSTFSFWLPFGGEVGTTTLKGAL
ncbi:MAG: GAF domain-containing sensor histidine kinase [Candidatus Kerfeldbacteria bacterium]|nr:GAF domain-containing sensor histidine kinase [Candidatus Kerfeldbacteria bacterium]